MLRRKIEWLLRLINYGNYAGSDLLLLLVILAFPACQALLEAPISQMKQVNRYLYRRNSFFPTNNIDGI